VSLYFYKKLLSVLCLLAGLSSLALLTGCENNRVYSAPKLSARTVDEAVSGIRENKKNSQPFKAFGKCRAKFFSDGNQFDEKFSVKLWVSPPNRLRLHGDVFFDPRGIDLGANEDFFWLVTRPNEIRSYRWGQWSEKTKFEDMILNPTQLLEAFGLLADMSNENTVLASMQKYDLLVRKDFMDRYKDRVYIDNRTRFVSKIEYFDTNNEIVLITELSNYKQIANGFKIPMTIRIISNPNRSIEEMADIRITLNSAEIAEIKDEIFLNKPDTEGFKRITKYTSDGFTVEQLR